jgi:hypothetical protein
MEFGSADAAILGARSALKQPTVLKHHINIESEIE